MIKIVTYMRANEHFTAGLTEAYRLLSELDRSVSLTVFTSSGGVAPKIPQEIPSEILVMDGTKYARLLWLIRDGADTLYFSIDNDIMPDAVGFKRFAEACLREDVDFAWGRIMADAPKTFCSKLVAIDKIISHNYIRPLTWHLGVGISVPGQCYAFKPASFTGKMKSMDTFLDDLAVGLILHKQAIHIQFRRFNWVTAHEIPNTSFNGLVSQRKRWANGFASIWTGVDNLHDKMLVGLHGFLYHFLWIAWYALLLMVACVSIPLTFILIVACSLIFAHIDHRLFPYAIAYQIIFPILHLLWIVHFFKELKHGTQ